MTETKIEDIEQQMKDAGWKTYNHPFLGNQNSSERFRYDISYQKRFDDNVGKKYFIDCNKHVLDGHPSFTFVTQFKDKNDQSVNIETVQWFFVKDKYDHHIATLEEVIEFFEKMWRLGEFEYYEKWSEA